MCDQQTEKIVLKAEDNRITFLYGVFLLASIILIYNPLLSYGWLQIEDGTYYLRNPLLGSGGGLARLASSWTQAPESNWMPLTWLVAIVLESGFGMSAKAFHGASILVHSGNALLVFYLAQRYLKSSLNALIVSLIFALHPLQVESVAWASSLKGSLSAFFSLLAVVLVSPKRKLAGEIVLALAFACSLLCKQTLLTLPLVIALMSSDSLRDSVRALFSRWWLLLLSLGAGLILIWANQDHANINTENGAIAYGLKGLHALGHYVSKSVFPSGLYPEYQYRGAQGGLVITGFIVLFVSVLGLFWRHSQFRFLAIFTALLFPLLGWWASPLELAADRLIYLPLFFLVIFGMQFFPTQKRMVSLVFGIVIVCVLSVFTRKQIMPWRSDEALCRHILSHCPDHYLAKLNLGLVHARKGDFIVAEKVLSDNRNDYPHRISPTTSLSQVLIASGRTEEAVELVEVAHQKYNQADFAELRARTYRDLGLTRKAIAAFMELENREGRSFEIAINLVSLYLKSGENDLAKQALVVAKSLNPNSPTVSDLEGKLSRIQN